MAGASSYVPELPIIAVPVGGVSMPLLEVWTFGGSSMVFLTRWFGKHHAFPKGVSTLLIPLGIQFPLLRYAFPNIIFHVGPVPYVAFCRCRFPGSSFLHLPSIV
jgi:hypothetical protein